MRRLAALGFVIVLLGLLVVAQLLLPRIAANRIRDQLARSGQVLEVQVHAFPAIELLWHRADSMVIRLGRYRSAPIQLGATVDQSAAVDSLQVSAAELDTGLLTLRNARLRKQGDRLTASAGVTEADLRTALPILRSVTPVASGDGQLTLRGRASLFGVSATLDATVRAQNGALVIAPDGALAGLATVTAFSNPHLAVQSVGAAAAAGGFSVTATGRLH